MSGSLSTLFSSPTQASDIYSQVYGFPKQRHAFLVNFLTNPLDVGGTSSQGLTYAIKSVDRPNIQPHTEELNQYNKKRYIYTGYKISPLKLSFYDGADCSAQTMWANYTRYYFGDFSQSSPQMFSGADIYGPHFMDGVGNYGFVAPAQDPDGQFYFKTITILHFYATTYDIYTLINPRIVSFSPDELDYSEAAVATINVELSYEALFFTPNSGLPSGQVPEFSDMFNGHPYDIVGGGIVEQARGGGYAYDASLNSANGTDGIVQSLFGSGFDGSSILSPDFRTFSESVGSGLGVFGNYSFGAAAINGINFGSTIATNLASLAVSNPSLAAVLNLQYANTNPLAYTGGSLATYNSAQNFLPGGQLGIAGAQVSAGFAVTPFGGIQATLTQGVLGANLVGAAGMAATAAGVTLSNAALSIINSQQPGMVQYGFNPNSANQYGQSYGGDGPGGYDGPAPADAFNSDPSIEFDDESDG